MNNFYAKIIAIFIAGFFALMLSKPLSAYDRRSGSGVRSHGYRPAAPSRTYVNQSRGTYMPQSRGNDYGGGDDHGGGHGHGGHHGGHGNHHGGHYGYYNNYYHDADVGFSVNYGYPYYYYPSWNAGYAYPPCSAPAYQPYPYYYPWLPSLSFNFGWLF